MSISWYGVGVLRSGIRATVRSGGECFGVELLEKRGGDICPLAFCSKKYELRFYK
jgi:hypothetical protein